MQQLAGLRHGEQARGDRAAMRAHVPVAVGARDPALISANGKALWNGLVLVALFLWTMHLMVVTSLLAGVRMPGSDRFNLDLEGNLPTFFSSTILLVSALLLGLLAVLKKNEGDRFSFHWAVLALVFLLLATDEAASFHELLGEPLRIALGLTGYLRFSWVLVGGVFVVVFAYAYSRFLLNLPRRVAGMFLLSGGVYVAGAIGFEMVSANVFDESQWNNWQYLAAITVEEMLEMSGVLLFVRTLLFYLRTSGAAFSLRFA